MFGIDIFDAALLPALFIAVMAGAISFLSPCVLPIVPPYVAYMGGVSMQNLSNQAKGARRRAVVSALFFVLGLSTVFLLMGLAAAQIGQALLPDPVWFGRIAGVVIIVFGLHFVGLFRLPFLMQEARIDVGDRGGSAFGAYILGLAFAFGWTPCIGPILSAILSLAAQEAEASRAVALMLGYSIGLGIPFILVAIYINPALRFFERFKHHMRKVEIAMGLLLILIGVAMLTGAFSAFSFWLLEAFPALASFG